MSRPSSPLPGRWHCVVAAADGAAFQRAIEPRVFSLIIELAGMTGGMGGVGGLAGGGAGQRAEASVADIDDSIGSSPTGGSGSGGWEKVSD